MSDEPILPRYLGERDGATTESQDGDTTEACRAFGWLRGIRDRAIMLELRKANGNILVKDYNRLEGIEFNPSEGITLCFSDQKIRIRGRNLNTEHRPSIRLFEGLVRHRVSWIAESDKAATMQANRGDTVVESIEVEA